METTRRRTSSAITGQRFIGLDSHRGFIMILMAIFLFISLSTSAFMNWYNRHVALVAR